MAELILGFLCIVLGVIGLLVAALVFFANAHGAATNYHAVDHTPMWWALGVAAASFLAAFGIFYL